MEADSWSNNQNVSPSAVSSVAHVCAVAVVRDEMPFLDEWIAYHHLLGIEHFYLYDDDPSLPLKDFLVPHRQNVTVIDWFRQDGKLHRSRQTNAYKDSLSHLMPQCSWITFLDIDEFIVLPNHADIRAFLGDFAAYDQISLPWLVFGHNGHFNDPPGLVITSLTRRMACLRHDPARIKSIVKVEAIARARTHACNLRPDRNHLYLYNTSADPDPQRVSQSPRVNHYMCRSFNRWMRRPERGAVTDANMDRSAGVDWKLSRAGCLTQFVEIIANECNAVYDPYMVRFEEPIKAYLARKSIPLARSAARAAHAFEWVKPRLSITPNEFVVYTAISAGYDSLKEQEDFGVPFVAFLDEPAASTTWQIRPMDVISSDNNRNAKIHKVLAHKYFPNVEYSLWIDGSITLRISPKMLAEMYLEEFDLVVHRHADRQCLYREARQCLRRRLDNPRKILAQIDRYKQSGFPRNMGLFENILILRRHNDRVRAFNELWWQEIQNGSRRDQISAVYAASHVGLKVGYFPGCPWPSRPTFNGFCEVAKHLGQNRWSRSRDDRRGNRT